MERTGTENKRYISPDANAGVLKTVSDSEQKLKKLRKDFIYINALTTGVDLMCATGGDYITLDNLYGLQYGGFLDYSTDDIFNSHFDDLDDYNNVVRESYEDQTANSHKEKLNILSEIAEADIPDMLFKKIEFVADETLSAKRFRKSGKETFTRDIGIISDDIVDDEQKITRYAKYKLAKKLLREVRDDVSEQRLVGIAMGIFLDEDKSYGKKISSYQSEIRKASGDAILQADVELAAEDAKLYDYIFPNDRMNFQSAIKKSATEPVIIPLKRKDEAYGFITPELYFDLHRKQILVGKFAVEATIERGAKISNIHKIGELLLSDNIKLPNIGQRSKNDIPKEKLIIYSQWLLNIVVNEPKDKGKKDLSEKVIRRAFNLGLGPSYQEAARRTFSSLTELYKELGHSNLYLAGQFDEWPRHKFIEYLKSAAEVVGRMPTIEDLVMLSREDQKRPTPFRIINEFGNLTKAYHEAGFKYYANGKRFMNKHAPLDYTTEGIAA